MESEQECEELTREEEEVEEVCGRRSEEGQFKIQGGIVANR